MRRRYQAKPLRSPSPDVETDEDMRREHFAYYHIPYSYCARKPESTETPANRDHLEDDNRLKTQIKLPTRRRLVGSPMSATELEQALPLHVHSRSRRSAALELLHRESTTQTLLADVLSRNVERHDMNQQLLANLNEIGPSHSARYNHQLRNLTADLGGFNMEGSHEDELELQPERIFERRGAISARGSIGIEELSAALSIDLHMRPSVEDVTDDSPPEETILYGSNIGAASRLLLFKKENKEREYDSQDCVGKPREPRKDMEKKSDEEQEEDM